MDAAFYGSVGRAQIGLEKMPLTLSSQLDAILAPVGLSTARLIMPKASASDPARDAQSVRAYGMGWSDNHVWGAGAEDDWSPVQGCDGVEDTGFRLVEGHQSDPSNEFTPLVEAHELNRAIGRRFSGVYSEERTPQQELLFQSLFELCKQCQIPTGQGPSVLSMLSQLLESAFAVRLVPFTQSTFMRNNRHRRGSRVVVWQSVWA